MMVERPRSILHVDMDTFFVSVERKYQPNLVGKPLIIGQKHARSVVSCASYEARAYGIRAAMPVAQALRLCPSVHTLAPNMRLYRQESREVMNIFQRFTPLVEAISVDEAFLDVSGAQRLFGNSYAIAKRIQDVILQERSLPASVGIANTKFVAKLASSRAKPFGLLEIPQESVIDFLETLPIQEVWGIGPSAYRKLNSRGIRTLGDIRQTSRESLTELLGKAQAKHLFHLSRGEDERPVQADRGPKSMSHEETFPTDVHDRERVRQELFQLSERLAFRLRKHGYLARTVGLKIRWNTFETVVRTKTLPEPSNTAQRIYHEVRKLLEEVENGLPVRLIGVKAENLEQDSLSELLFSEDEQWSAVEKTADIVQEKFGKNGLRRARFIPQKNEDSNV